MGTTSSYGMHFNDMKRTKKIIRKERRKIERAEAKQKSKNKKQLLNNIIIAIEEGRQLEMSKHDDWDDDKHTIRCEINLDNEDGVQLHFTKENQQ
tara:strand:- start:712 stop:996 length:285 start_codon:yes stop_codon:yes gene_type:complete